MPPCHFIRVIDSLTTKIQAAESRLGQQDRGAQVRDALWFQRSGCSAGKCVLRGELSTIREIADRRIRVERMEKERGQLPQ